MNQKEEVCLALPSLMDTEKIRYIFSKKPFAIQYKVYSNADELGRLLIDSECEVYLFSSEFLPYFSDVHRLIKFKPNEIEVGRVSPDYLGLNFDRLNEHFFPIAYWEESSQGKVFLHLMLATATTFSKNLVLVKSVLEDFLSNEFQSVVVNESKLGTVLKDSEIDLAIKSSAIRKNNLSDIVIVKDASKTENSQPKEELKAK